MSRMSQESDNEYGDYDYCCYCGCCPGRRRDFKNLFDAIWNFASSEKVLELIDKGGYDAVMTEGSEGESVGIYI